MPKKIKQSIINFLPMLIVLIASGVLLMIYSKVTTPKYMLFFLIHRNLSFITVILMILLFTSGLIWFYCKNLKRRLILKNIKLKRLYTELKESQIKLKLKLEESKISERRLKRSEERYNFVMNTLKVGIWDYDAITGTTYIAPQLYNIFGFNSGDLENYYIKWPRKIHSEDRLKVFRYFREKLKYKDSDLEYQFRHITKHGEYRWVQAIARCEWDQEGNLLRLAGSITDIDEKKANEEKIKHMAYFDSLTGLPNRAYLHEYVNNVIKNGAMCAFIFIDIDNFKYVNDFLGHNIGDSVIVDLSKKISGLIPHGIMARWGGDEIIVLLERVKSHEEVNKFTRHMIEKVYSSFGSSGVTMNLSISAGVAIFPDHGSDFETLLKNADTAMYSAKDSGKNNYKIFDNKMNEVIFQKMKYEGLLRTAIENNELELYFQPQYDMKSGILCGIEALMRWNHKELGNISPLEFIPVAESSGLILPLGFWAFKEACKFQLLLVSLGYNNIPISVNISPLQFKQEGFIQQIKSYIAENGVNPKMLEFELTENILIDSSDSTIEKLMELRELGIRIALDDFGIGYSSLTYLRKLPIDTLKMDKSFIENVSVNKVDNDISGFIVNVAHSLGLKVIAEGVETTAQRDVLMNFGCDMVQGFLYSEPMINTELIRLLEKNKVS